MKASCFAHDIMNMMPVRLYSGGLSLRPSELLRGSLDQIRKLWSEDIKMIREMHAAGVPFLAGTDALAMPNELPGFILHDELQLLVRAGLTPLAALQAATLNPARYLNKEKETGSIEKGKLADIVLLDANPLKNISNTKRIWAVVANGNYFSRADLDKMLSNVQTAARNN